MPDAATHRRPGPQTHGPAVWDRSPPDCLGHERSASHLGHPEGPVHPQSSRGPAEAFVCLLRFTPPPALSCLLHSRTGPAVTVPPHCCLPESWSCCTRHPIPILLTRSACPFSPTFCCTSDRTSRFCGTWARLPSPSERDPPSGDRPLLAVSLMCLKGLKQPLARGRCSTKRRTNIQTHAWGRGLSLKGVLGLTGERGRHVRVPSSLGRCRNSTDGDRRVTTRTIPRYLEGFSAFTKETVWPEGRKEEPGGPHPGLPGSEPCGRAGARGGAPRALRHKGLLKGIH